ncbi:gamma-glutamyltranspeptidase [Trichodelitschia bisporula]|uniref:Glutathione hydrolase n=1 Tax=Trichodelitschia bisporula TaxID=703511 RepID=A0A6G1IBI0_9PEZI|nr:gamma-glutamyltranspeptidase [Trichodelitschia bisporula]
MAPILLSLLTSQLALSLPAPSAPPTHAAIATESKLCTHIGLNILKSSPLATAADALVASVLCIGVVAPYHSGLGGGGFGLIRAPNGSYTALDFRECAPAAAFEDMYQGNVQGSITSGLASGVPGEPAGLAWIHDHFGGLPWKDVVRPAVALARDGFAVGADLARYMASAVGSGRDFLSEDPSWAIDFAPNGTRLGVGDWITRRRYADLLQAVGERGVRAFYEGPIAEATIATIQAHNGSMTMEDLKEYAVIERKPATVEYRGQKLTSVGAPSGGVVAMAIMNIVGGYEGFGDPEEVNLTTHRLDEAMRFAYGMRTNLGDPSFVENLASYESGMISPATGADVRSRITEQTHNISYYNPGGFAELPTPGTSHLVATDSSGLTITLTTTVNLLFGSQLIVPETGLVLNNEMNDFSIPGTSNAFGYIPSPANYIRPRKRPQSSISPVIAEYPDGRMYVATGAAGGSRITTATVQNLIHILDGGMDVAEALAQPRLHDQLVPDNAVFEWGVAPGLPGYDNATVASMKARGHNVTWVAPGLSSAHAVRVLPNGTMEAAGEPRGGEWGGMEWMEADGGLRVLVGLGFAELVVGVECLSCTFIH